MAVRRQSSRKGNGSIFGERSFSDIKARVGSGINKDFPRGCKKGRSEGTWTVVSFTKAEYVTRCFYNQLLRN